MKDYKVLTKKGKELSQKELQIINDARIKHFNSKSLIQPTPENEDWEKLYFVLYSSTGELGAFARYHDINVVFDSNTYNILGSATLIALIPNKGYGAAVKRSMINYAKEHKKTSIGFCNPKLSEYYASLGCGIIKDGSKRFYQIQEEGTYRQFLDGSDILYIEGDDKLITQMLEKPELPIYSYRYHW
jgi:hypothetical protein